MMRRWHGGAGLLVAALSAGVVWPGRIAGQSPADSLAVRAVALGIIAADNARDLDRVVGYYAPGAMLLPPNEVPVQGLAGIRPRYEALFRDFNPAIEGRIDEVRVEGMLAMVRGFNGGVLRGIGRPDRRLADVYLMVLEKRSGAWRITRLIWHGTAPASAVPG